MTRFICNDCGMQLPSPHVLAIHVIQQHHPNLILESSEQRQPPNTQNHRSNNQFQGPNAQHQPPNATQHVQPFDLNQPPNVQYFDLNLSPTSQG